MYEYNSQLPEVVLKEYGRNVQKLAEYVSQIEDTEKRNQYAYTLVELMHLINPNTRDSQDYQNKVWDDLFIISKFELEVDSPYPMPEKDVLGKKPQKVDYPSEKPQYKHYGLNIERLIQHADTLENEEERFAAFAYVGRLMKTFYLTWNKDNVPDTLIIEHMNRILGKGKSLDESLIQQLLADGVLEVHEVKIPSANQQQHHHHNQKKGKKKKKTQRGRGNK